MVRVTELSGGPYERGLAHGRALRPRIEAHLAAWKGCLAEAAGRPAGGYVRGMLRDTDYLTAIGAHTPDLLEEVHGVADGAEAERDVIYALQLLDEEWAYRARGGGPTPDKCSSFALALPDGPTWIGQTMDLGAYTDGHQAVLRIAADGAAPAALVFTTAGVIGLMGVNAAGVGVCVNSLPQLPSAPEGLPVAFVLRRLLQATSLAEASDLALSLPHATNQHYLIAEAGAVRSFEASAAGVTEYHPPDPARVFHTNHPLAAQGAPETDEARLNTVRRLASLAGRLAAGAPGLADLQAALSACDDPEHPVCRTGAGNIGFTCGAMISALPHAGGEVRSWVSPGPPTREGFTPLWPATAAAAAV